MINISRWLGGFVAASSLVVGGVMMTGAASAQDVPPSCFLAPAKLSDQAIKDFMAEPAALLVRNASGGLPLSTEVRSLAGSSADTIPVLIELAKGANAGQQAAIGAGLARAAVACAKSSPSYAEMIQQAVAESGLGAMVTAFLAASSEVQTAALPGGAPGGAGPTGGGGGGIGGGARGGGGTAGFGGQSVVAQAGGSLSGNGSGGFVRGGDNNSVSGTTN